MKWSVHKWRCRRNYQGCCRPTWLASPPPDDGESWFSLEFDTWAEAMDYVWRQLADDQTRSLT